MRAVDVGHQGGDGLRGCFDDNVWKAFVFADKHVEKAGTKSLRDVRAIAPKPHDVLQPVSFRLSHKIGLQMTFAVYVQCPGDALVFENAPCVDQMNVTLHGLETTYANCTGADVGIESSRTDIAGGERKRIERQVLLACTSLSAQVIHN